MECPICLEQLDSPAGLCPLCGYRLGRPMPARNRPEFPPREAEPVLPVETLDAPAERIPFIGRDEELRQLREVLARPSPDRPRLVVVQGEAGSGKSRLTEEGTRGLYPSQIQVLWRAQPHGAMVMDGPILQWIRELAALGSEEAPETVKGRLATLVEQTAGLEPADAGYLNAALGLPGALNEIQGIPEDHVRRNLERLFGRLLAAQAESAAGPCLIVDQAQWLDRATGEFLNDLLEDEHCPAAAIIVLTRDAGTGWFPRAKPDLVLRLEPLATEGRARMLEAVAPALEFLPELRRRVIEQSAGSPLFLRELGRLVRQVMAENAGPIRAGEVANIVEIMPLSLDELIGRRIERIEGRTRLLLDVAAILGPEFSLGLLECFDQIREDLVVQLRALEGLRLIHRIDGGDGPRYQFIEGYVRDLAYGALLEDQRRALHAQVAAAIEKIFGEQLDAHYELLAYHTARAAEPERAVYYQIKAADRHERLGDIRSAMAGYEQALDGISGLEATALNQTRMARVLLRQGRLLRYQGNADAALVVIESAQALGERLDNDYLRFQARTEQALVWLWQGRNEESGKLLTRLREEARRLRQTAGECLILNALGVIDWHAGRFEPALATFRELAERARALGMEHQEADALNNTGLIYWRWNRYPEAARSFRAAAAIRMRWGDRFGLVAALLNLGIIQEQMGEVRPALKNYTTALEYACQTGFARGQATLEVNLSNLERRAGLASSALEHAARAVRLARRAEDPLAETAALENLGLAQAALGRMKEAEDSLREALELARRAGAAEKQAQIELDLLETLSRDGRDGPERLEAVCELLRRIEAAGWHDLLSQACRLKGRLLQRGAASDNLSARRYLKMALDYATQSHNVFEEWEALGELLAWGAGDEDDARQTQEWKARAGRIEEMVRARGGD